MNSEKSLAFDPDIAAALSPSRENVLAANASVAGGAASLSASEAVDARRAMNAMQTVASALKMASLAPEGSQATRFQEVLDAAGVLARRILVRWGFNPDDRSSRWMANAIEKAVIPHLDVIPEDSEALDALADALAVRAADVPGIEAYRQERSVDIAIMRGVSGLMKAQSEFDFGRNATSEADLSNLRDVAMASSLDLMDILCPPLAPPSERATFLSLIVSQAFGQMEDSWRHNAVLAKRALSPLNKEQLAAWRRANPDGFSLDPVLASFRQGMARLERLTLAARKSDRRKR